MTHKFHLSRSRHQRTRERRRARHAWADRLAPRRTLPALELLEPRLLLSGISAAGDLGAEAGPPIPVGTVIAGGRLGDVITIDLVDLISPVSVPPGYSLTLDFPTPFDGVTEGQAIVDVPLFATTGKFHFAPVIATPSTGAEAPATGPAVVDADLEVTVIDPSLDETIYSGTLEIYLDDDYSLSGIDAVTFGSDGLDIYRQQQRLNYFGFVGADAMPLTLTGTLDADTQWAIGLFNSVANDENPADSGDPGFAAGTFEGRGPLFMNASDRMAPRWKDVNPGGLAFTGTAETHGTSWVEEILADAAAPASYMISDISAPAGAYLPPHGSHQAGLDVDVDVPVLVENLDRTFFQQQTGGFASATGNDPFGSAVTDGYLIRQTLDGAGGAVSGNVFAAWPDTSPPAGDLTVGTWETVHRATLVASGSMLGDAHAAGLLLLDASYSRAEMDAQFTSLFGAVTPSGTYVSRLFWNDPFFYDDPSRNYGGRIQYWPSHNGHYHFDIHPPTSVTGSTTGQLLRKLGDFFETALAGALEGVQGVTASADGVSATATAFTGIPFIDEALDDVISLPSVFDELANRLNESVTISAAAAPSTFNAAGSFFLALDGGTPTEVMLDATGNGNITALVADLDAALVSAGLDDRLAAGEDGGVLTIGTIDDGLAQSLTLTTLRLEAPGAGPAWGQLGANLTFNLDVDRTFVDPTSGSPTSETLSPALTILAADTTDNATLHDLADDINLAIMVEALSSGDLELGGLVVLVDPGANPVDILDDQLVIASARPDITQLTISGAGATTLGFTGGQIADESDNPISADLKFSGERAIADLKINSLFDLEAILVAELTAISDAPLPGGFDLDWAYDNVDEIIYFDLALNRDFSTTVELDLTDGIDLGGLGTLELTATTDASFDASIDLSFRVGMSLAELGEGLDLTGATLLADLNAGEGVGLHVGVTGASPAPPDGQLTSAATVNVSLNGGAPQSLTVAASSTTTNVNVFDLAIDLNDAIVVAGLDTQIEALADGAGHLNLVAIDETIHTLLVAGGADFGFSGSQSGDRADITIMVDTTPYDVQLDGATTVQDVIDAIDTQTSSQVVTTIDNAAKLLVLTTVSGDPVSVSSVTVNGTPSLAGLGLGILGSNDDGVLTGTPLHGESSDDRVFIVEPGGGDDPNLEVSVGVLAEDIDLRAALGLFGITVTDDAPLDFDLALPLRLLDPGTGADDDGRITLAEARNNPVADLVDLPTAASELTAGVSGTLVLGADLFDSEFGVGLAQVSVSLGTPDDLTSIQFDIDTAGLDDAIDQLKNLSIQDLLNLLRDLIDRLADADDLPILNTEIPLLDKSLGDVISFLDQVLDAIDAVAAIPDLDELTAARDALETAISNLPVPVEQKEAVLTALAALDGVLNGPEADVLSSAGSLAAASDVSAEAHSVSHFISRLISAVNTLEKNATTLIGLLPPGPLATAATNAMATVTAAVPSLDTLADRLENAVNAHLPGLVTFSFDIVDYDTTTPGMQYAVVAGLTAGDDDLATIDFSPSIGTTLFGPIDLNASGDFTLRAGGTLSVGFGLNLAAVGTPEPIVIINNSAGLTPTALNLNGGFDGAFSGGVSFGSLEAVSADAEMSLLTSVRDENLTVTAAVVTLSAAPLNDDERFVIVIDQAGDRVSPDDFSVSGTTLTFTGSGVPTEATVTYQTATTPGGTAGTGRDVNVANRATFDIDFDDPTFTITDNTIGAVPFSTLFGGGGPAIQVDANGLIVGALDAEFLSQRAEDAITLAVEVNNLLQPQLAVDEDALLAMLQNVEFDLKTIVAGVEAFLDLLETGLTSTVISSLPLVGGGLSTAGTFLGKLRTDFVTPFKDFLCNVNGTLDAVADDVRDFIFDVIGPPGLNILGDGPDGNTTISVDDIVVNLDPDAFEIVFRLFGYDEILLGFNPGLAGLPISADGGLSLGWNFDIEFGVGADRISGFYLVTNPEDGGADPEYELNLDVGLIVDDSGSTPIPTSVGIDLWGLKLTATDNLDGSDPGTRFQGQLALDLVDPDLGDGLNRLPVADIFNLGFTEVFTASLTTSVDVDIHLGADINANLPSVGADLVAHWDFQLTTLGGDITTTTAPPTVGIYDITLDLGDFLGKYLGPAVEKVDAFLEPIRPILDILEAKVPGVSDISEAAGNGTVTVLDLAFAKKPEQGKKVKKFIGVISKIADVVAAIGAASSGTQLLLNFGSISFGGTENSVDLSVPGWNTTSTFDSALASAAASAPPVDDQVAGSGNSAMSSSFFDLQREPDSGGLGGLGIQLDFLKPVNIFKYLLGNTADIITWDIPRFDLTYDWSQKFNVWPTPPIALEIGLNLSAFMDLSVGYDTRGLTTGNFFDGFFFGDRADVSTGPDIDEFGFGLGVSLAALLDVGVASAGVEGEIRGDVFANWRDTNNDGKLYVDEMVRIVKNDGFLCLFDLRAEISAIVRLVWQAFGFEGSYDLLDVVIASFTSEGSCPKLTTGHVADGTAGDGGINVLPEGHGTAADGTLIVHAGAFGHLRQVDVSSDTHESFKITELAPGVYDVKGMGIEDRFSEVERIFFHGGVGNDALELVGVTIPVIAYGNDGADDLMGGTADDLLDGGNGADALSAGAGNDTVVGGGGGDVIDTAAGNDSVDAGAGNDLIDVGADDDTVDAGGGDDTVFGGAGGDVIDGGSGNDSIEGSDGADVISGGPNDDSITGDDGADLISGNAGRDTIHGGLAGDTISGGSGDDRIFGDDGDDEMRGDSGHDLLEGADDDDVILAGTGNDLLIGGFGSDELYGSWGNDIVLGHLVGNVSATDGEHLEGGPNDDFICGAEGIDTIFGGTSDLLRGFDHFLEDDELAVSSGGYSLASCVEVPSYVPSPPAAIHGRKYADNDGNGAQGPDEPGLNGWTIELYDDAGDLVDTRTTADMDLDLSTTIEPVDESGLYWFDNLDPGIYTVVEVQQSGFEQTAPAGGSYTLTLVDNQVVEDIDFGNRAHASVHGMKWDDLDRDGARDPGEPGLAGITIFVDLDGNGVLDGGEPTTVTMADDPDTSADETGMYWLEGLAPGTYQIAETLPVGWISTSPAVPVFDTAVAAADADQFVTSDAGGAFDSAQRVALPFSVDRQTYLDTVSFLGLYQPAGTPLADDFTVTIYGDDTVDPGAPDPGNILRAANVGDVGRSDTGYNIGGREVYAYQADLNGVLLAAGTTYHVAVTNNSGDGDDAWAWTGIGSGVFAASFDSGNTWDLFAPFTPAVTLAGAVGSQEVVVGAGDIVEHVDFGNSPPRGDVHGQKFLDANGSGKQDPGEWGLDGWTIELVDAAGNVVATTTTMSVDLDLDGEIDPSHERGHYWLQGVEPGTYFVREVVQPGWEPILPPEVEVFVDVGHAPTVDFANRPIPPSVHGLKFEDLDGNGRQDEEEPLLPGVTVYVDVNENGVPDTYTESFISDDVPHAVDDGATMDSGLYVVTDGTFLLDVNVTLDIEHPVDGDLTARLISPAGTSVLLFSGVGAGGANFTDTTLDDQADASIATGDAPFSGAWVPMQPLSGLVGENPRGLWHLEVDDAVAGDDGALREWSLELTVAEPTTTTMTDIPGTPVDETGHYWLEGLAPGVRRIAEVVPAGYVQTHPDPDVDDGAYVLTLHWGDMIEGIDFGNMLIEGGDTDPPQVVGVLVDGSTWTDAFTAHVDPTGQGGYAIPVGSGAQVRPLGWRGIDIVRVRFSEDVAIGAADLTMSGVTVPSYPIAGFNYDPANFTATWTLAEPVIRDKILLAVSDAVEDGAGNALDGEWDNPTSTIDPTSDTYPSGDGAAGVPFQFRFNVARSDITQDGTVDLADVARLRAAIGRRATAPDYDAPADLNADGVISILDIAPLRRDVGTRLPQGDPVVPPLGAAGAIDTTTASGRTGTATGIEQVLRRRLGPVGPSGDTADPTGGVGALGFPGGPPSVHGFKWEDLNGDGIQDPGEPGMPGVTIYVDLNGNGQFDPSEPSTVTMADDPATPDIDEAGMYWLDAPDFGDFIIREVVPAGAVQTFPTTRLLTHDAGGKLYDMDDATGQVLLPRGTVGGLIDIAYSPVDGLLYGVTSGTPQLVTINVDTGAFTPIGVLNIEAFEGDLDFDPTTGVLYGIRGNFDFLYTINTSTAVATLVGAMALPDPSAMAFDAAGNLYVLDGALGQVVKVDKSDASVLATASLSETGFGALAGMDFDPATGQLLVVNGQVPTPGAALALYDLDPATGAMTLIGTHGQHLAGLEFVPDGAHVVRVEQGRITEGVDFGNTRPELLLLPDGDDEIHAFGDDDSVHGDNLVGAAGVLSEGGADLIFGGAGADDLFGQEKDDVIWGADPDTGLNAPTSDGNDQIDGGVDTDEVRQTVDNDQVLTNGLLTGLGNDTLVSIEQATLTGGPSGNQIDASAFGLGPVTLIGADGPDLLLGSPDDDVLRGGAGDDTLTAGAGADELDGGGGGDDMAGGDGDDTYVFAAAVPAEGDTVTESASASGGIDTLDFDALGAGDPVNVDLTSAAIASHTGRTVSSPDPSLFEHVRGGAGDDPIVGNAADNDLQGGAGDDTISGLGGEDTLTGGGGSDDLDGGDDDDRYVFETSAGGELDTLSEAAGASGGVDTLDFGTLASDDPVDILLANGLIALHTGRQVSTATPGLFENARGGGGDDTLGDNDADNRLSGGPGDDRFVFGNATGAQADWVLEQAGAGVDTVDFGGLTAGVNVDLALTLNFATDGTRTVSGPAANLERVLGGTGNDTIAGNASANELLGGLGDDSLAGAAGADTLVGGHGSDTLSGDADDDTYVFEPALVPESDVISELAGPSGGVDTIDFGVLPPSQPVTIDLDPSATSVATHTNRVLTSPDASLLENAAGGSGHDVIAGNQADNVLSGGAGNDDLEGRGGNDTLDGGEDDDIYRFGGAGTGPELDVVVELTGGGLDTLDFTVLPAADPVVVDLSAEFDIAMHTDRTVSTAVADQGVNVENATGGAGPDTITGNSADNALVGGDGDDMLDGGLGADVLVGGAGTNTLTGGGGDDTYRFTPGVTATDTLIEDNGVVTLGLASGGGSDTLDFAAVNQAVTFDLTLTTQSPTALITVNLRDSVGGTGTPNTANFENVTGTQLFANVLTGSTAANILRGGPLGDVLDGGDDDDVLIGRGGPDTITGGNGNDALLGGDDADLLSDADGRNLLVGGSGADQLTGGLDDDVLIGDQTFYSALEDLDALAALVTEWSSPIRTYTERITNLSTGVGAGGVFVLIPSLTVLFDGFSDSLTGAAGLDWFFNQLSFDTVVDLQSGEIVVV